MPLARSLGVVGKVLGLIGQDDLCDSQEHL